MRMSMKGVRRLATLAAAAMAMTAFGCAQQVGDINRVQANALSKADFTDGEWYIRQTISEVPPAAYAGFVGVTGDLEKIRWEINEDYLIAYRSYENNPGSRTEATVDENGEYTYLPFEQEGYSDEYKESPVAAYRIMSHFDIQRSYNSSTGEQNNVISENGSDRLWYEREYFRVDWSNVLDTQQMFDSYFTAGVNWYVQDSEDSLDALNMEYFDPAHLTAGITAADYTSGELYYMDFTSRMLLSPGYSYCWGHWYPQTVDECASSEVEIRTSLLRVPAVSEYEPIFYDEFDQAKFGYFRTERLVYDRQLGERLSNQILLANRHNIWQNTWQRDADGSVARDANGRAVALPFAQRTAKPVVYHVNVNFPESLWDETQALSDEWDRAFRRAVGAAHQIDPNAAPRMFVVCHNPVLQEDPVDCGEIGTVARIGDLRYNFLYWVDQPQASGPLGYGPTSADPETGEAIAGQAFVYGSSIDTYAYYALELVRFFNGDLDIAGITDADHVRADLMANADPNVDPRGLIDPNLMNFDIHDIQLEDMLTQSNRDFLTLVDTVGLDNFEYRPEQVRERHELIAESGLGALAVNDEIMNTMAAMWGRPGVNGGRPESLADFPEEVVNQFFDNGTFMMPRMMDNARDRHLAAAQQNIWLAESMDDTVVGLAMAYAGRTDYDNIYEDLRGLIYKAVTEHELGHTLGLRHNFQGSFDSLNYFDRFWELKTAGVYGGNDTNSFGVVPFGPPSSLGSIVGLAHMTPAQREGRMREFQYSSIMDYSSMFNTDLHGIGKYDEAAIIYAYTTGRNLNGNNQQERGYVEVFNNTGAARELFMQFEGQDSPAYTDMLEFYHYSTVAVALATEPGGCAFNQGYFDCNGYPSDPNQAAMTVRQRMSDRSLVRMDDLAAMRDDASTDGTRPIEVPYLFLSDYWVGARQSARLWDQGADPLEQALQRIETYRTYYPFQYFRRDRLSWSPSSIINALAGRYLPDLIDNYQRWVFDVLFYDIDPVMANGWTFAAYASLNLFAEIMTTPEYGSYSLGTDDYGNSVYELDTNSQQPNAQLYIPQGEGRVQYSNYDPSLGYNYWAYPEEGGHFWAYYAAVITLAASSSVEVRGADTGADFRTYSIPPYLLFQDEVETLFNGLWLQDNAVISPNVVNDGTGKMVLRHRLFAPLQLDANTILNPETMQTYAGAEAEAVTMGREYGDTTNTTPTADTLGGFTYRYLPLLYGMAFFDMNFNTHYADQNRVFYLGSGENVDFGAGSNFDQAIFCHNTGTGECFGALRDSTAEIPTAAVRLIDEANAAVVRWEAASGNDRASIEYEIANLVELMNMSRGMYEIFSNVMN